MINISDISNKLQLFQFFLRILEKFVYGTSRPQVHHCLLLNTHGMIKKKQEFKAGNYMLFLEFLEIHWQFMFSIGCHKLDKLKYLLFYMDKINFLTLSTCSQIFPFDNRNKIELKRCSHLTSYWLAFWKSISPFSIKNFQVRVKNLSVIKAHSQNKEKLGIELKVSECKQLIMEIQNINSISNAYNTEMQIRIHSTL